MNTFTITDLVKQHLPPDRKNSTTGFYVNCPMCVLQGEPRADSKHRGGFTEYPDGGFIYHCHNCGFSTKWVYNGRVGKNLMYFLRSIGVPPKQVPMKLRLLRQDEKLDVKIKIEEPEIVIEFPEVDLLPGARTIESWCEDEEPLMMFIDAFEYLAGRGDAVFDGGTYYWTDNPKYGNNERVINTV